MVKNTPKAIPSDSRSDNLRPEIRQALTEIYTATAPGKGTGLGLATVFGILKQHEGWVEDEASLRGLKAGAEGHLL